MNHSKTAAVTIVLAAFLQATACGLAPDEVAIVAVKDSPESRELAEYYARARGIPLGHIFLLDVPPTAALSRADWEGKVRPSLRRWLTQNKLEDKIRCLTTVWDVPLKIGPVDAQNPKLVEVKANLDAERSRRLERIKQVAAGLNGVLPEKGRAERLPPAETAVRQEWAEFLEAVLTDAKSRLARVKDRTSAEWREAASELERFYSQAGGITAGLRSLEIQLKANPSPPAELVRAVELRRGELVGLRFGLQALAGMSESASRDVRLLSILQQSDGLLGTLDWIEENQKNWKKNETYSSFDSELSLLWWPDYPLLRWYGNVLFYANDDSVREVFPRTLMVARLEAPTLAQAKRLVDTAIETEKNGLEGKIYLDARGLRENERSPGSLFDFDEALRELAKFLREETSLQVVLDNRDELFARGECPDAALYCGWYSLASYVDAFDWKPGAVGYHLASAECKTLREAGSNVWCKRMLEDGIGATLGPTYEPYLAAFPRPLDFFPLLLSGRYTLAEVYAATNPYTSWVMVLVGDPLYNPYKHNPQFDLENPPDVIKRLLRIKPPPAAVAPRIGGRQAGQNEIAGTNRADGGAPCMISTGD